MQIIQMVYREINEQKVQRHKSYFENLHICTFVLIRKLFFYIL